MSCLTHGLKRFLAVTQVLRFEVVGLPARPMPGFLRVRLVLGLGRPRFGRSRSPLLPGLTIGFPRALTSVDAPVLRRSSRRPRPSGRGLPLPPRLLRRPTVVLPTGSLLGLPPTRVFTPGFLCRFGPCLRPPRVVVRLVTRMRINGFVTFAIV